MTKQVEGVYERVLACAKEEFLEKRFFQIIIKNNCSKRLTQQQERYIPDLVARRDYSVPL